MYEKLFEPQKIGRVTIPNRLIVTAMATDFCTEDGMATERYIRYHEEKAKGGWGLIITGDYAISPEAKAYPHIGGLYKDEQIASHKKLTDTIHQYDTKIFSQIYHPGRQTIPAYNGGVQPVSASAIPDLLLKEMPHELTVPEIKHIVSQFGDAALRAKKAGFDGIEIHAAHGYLITQFLSPAINKRFDEYGGTFENRTRILHEILDDIRAKVGRDFPVSVRINALDLVEGGHPFIETIALAEMLEDWTADVINLSAGVYGAERPVGTLYDEDGWITRYAKELKNSIHIPVISSNRITDPMVAEAIVRDGRCDFVGMGRASLADPAFPHKAKMGEPNAIRRCLGCYQACATRLGKGTGISCLVNPEIGLEYQTNEKEKVAKPKNIMVVGAGLAGMEFAVTAAKQGHKVTVYEKEAEVGGEWRAAAYPPHKYTLASFTVWLLQEMKRLGVALKLNTEVTEDLLQQEKPDSIILATGGIPVRPSAIPGINRTNVHVAEDVLRGKVAVQGPIVVCGGGEVGCETAEFLAMHNKDVSVVEMRDEILIGSLNKKAILPLLEKYHVGIHTSAKVLAFTDEGVEIETAAGKKTLPAAHVVLSMGYRSYNPLAEVAKKYAQEVQVIGTAHRSGNGLDAVHEAYRVGKAI